MQKNFMLCQRRRLCHQADMSALLSICVLENLAPFPVLPACVVASVGCSSASGQQVDIELMAERQL